MSKFIKVSGAIALSMGLTFGAGQAAQAITAYPAGGTWQYGINQPSSTYYVYSNYHHPSALHRSTACNISSCSRSADRGAGIWSYASIVASGAFFGTNNTAYYYKY
jgi:lactococcin 972 family bacteriocin